MKDMLAALNSGDDSKEDLNRQPRTLTGTASRRATASQGCYDTFVQNSELSRFKTQAST